MMTTSHSKPIDSGPFDEIVLHSASRVGALTIKDDGDLAAPVRTKLSSIGLG